MSIYSILEFMLDARDNQMKVYGLFLRMTRS